MRDTANDLLEKAGQQRVKNAGGNFENVINIYYYFGGINDTAKDIHNIVPLTPKRSRQRYNL